MKMRDRPAPMGAGEACGVIPGSEKLRKIIVSELRGQP